MLDEAEVRTQAPLRDLNCRPAPIKDVHILALRHIQKCFSFPFLPETRVRYGDALTACHAAGSKKTEMYMTTLTWEIRTEIEYAVSEKPSPHAVTLILADTDGIFRARYAAGYIQKAARERHLAVYALARSLCPPRPAGRPLEDLLSSTFERTAPTSADCRQLSEADTCAALYIGVTSVHARAMLQMFPHCATRVTSFAAYGGDVYLPEKMEPQSLLRCAEALEERAEAVLNALAREGYPPYAG